MDSISKGELFSAILSSSILAQYLQGDPELVILMENPNQ
jgi:hypothetical protein